MVLSVDLLDTLKSCDEDAFRELLSDSGAFEALDEVLKSNEGFNAVEQSLHNPLMLAAFIGEYNPVDTNEGAVNKVFPSLFSYLTTIPSWLTNTSIFKSREIMHSRPSNNLPLASLFITNSHISKYLDAHSLYSAVKDIEQDVKGVRSPVWLREFDIFSLSHFYEQYLTSVAPLKEDSHNKLVDYLAEVSAWCFIASNHDLDPEVEGLLEPAVAYVGFNAVDDLLLDIEQLNYLSRVPEIAKLCSSIALSGLGNSSASPEDEMSFKGY